MFHTGFRFEMNQPGADFVICLITVRETWEKLKYFKVAGV